MAGFQSRGRQVHFFFSFAAYLTTRVSVTPNEQEEKNMSGMWFANRSSPAAPQPFLAALAAAWTRLVFEICRRRVHLALMLLLLPKAECFPPPLGGL